MTSPTSRPIPSHLREDVFRSYEPLITQALTAWPAETSFDRPSTVAPTTFVARFRDAILSALAFRWQPSTVDYVKLLEVEKLKHLVYESDGKLWWRHKRARGQHVKGWGEVRAASRPAHTSHSSTSAVLPGPVPWRDATQIEIRALVVLLDAGRLTGPYYLAGEVSPADTEDLMGSYNVAFVFDKEKNVTIVT